MRAHILISALLVLLAPEIATAQELWGGTHIGETPSQVRSKFPKAAITKEYDLGPGELMLDVPDITAGELPGDATALFSHNKLQNVTLHLNTDKDPHGAGLGQIVERLHGLIIQKYGKPYACPDDSTDDFTAYRCDWSGKGIHIELHVLSVGSVTDLYVSYETAPKTLNNF